ncbi:MAG: PIN domain-containing protein [Steroidobacteraceae bacterium]
MSDVVFVDTNILIYAHDRDAGQKRAKAAQALERLWDEHTGRLSTQVLQEFYVTVTQKLATTLTRASAREVVRMYSPWVHQLTTTDTILRASGLAELVQLSFWDSLILASAEQAQAAQLYSEDLNVGQTIAGIRIVNPLLAG